MFANQNELDQKISRICNRTMYQAKSTEKYKKMQLQIDCMKTVLVKNADIPESFIDNLISAVEEKTSLEYQSANSKLAKIIKRNIK